MRMTQALIRTMKETPSDADIPSLIFGLRSSIINKLGSGLYTLLPLGLKVVRKIETIIREEMDKSGAQELLLPILSPAELWQESGRWDIYGKELMRIQDRHDRDFALGPTHEEIITHLVRSLVKSYKELPLNLYQIQTKFRDEIRPRFGVMRAREFVMKDAYSFHRNEESLRETYQVMFDTYTRIFKRCGLKFKPVLADSGAIGGDVTHEFTVLAQTGESVILYCEDNSCGYAASSEYATGNIAPFTENTLKSADSMEKIHTPNLKTVDEVSAFFKVQPQTLIKTLLYKINDTVTAVLVRGEREVNEAKLQKAFTTPFVELADEKTVNSVTNAAVGFAGPVGLSIPVYADFSLKTLDAGITGANETNYHYKNVVLNRDFSINSFIDVSTALAGDSCIKCGKSLAVCRGIEVGQVFQLGTKYSKAMNATFHDENGEEKPFIMGCYGIGVTRTAGAAIEQSHDKDGIIWPYSIAPYHIIILPLNMNESGIVECAEQLYSQLTQDGYEVLLDDRDLRPGVKFKDADLIGIPIKIVIGKSFLNDKTVEVKKRIDGTTVQATIDHLPVTIRQIVNELKADVYE
ncbi:MAG: proline--tRNA ligase [Candidatus Auribacter fodinae]|uniref:Proline--tRNA ligase n=1 Tax=Candidatus Auribacter fodinae TaxID=2093366 RepID=A0A3A4QZD1_9BACT|nr:MAG: proline--tRNA ligase [Candidatus Auribacter fodinae]